MGVICEFDEVTCEVRVEFQTFDLSDDFDSLAKVRGHQLNRTASSTEHFTHLIIECVNRITHVSITNSIHSFSHI